MKHRTMSKHYRASGYFASGGALLPGPVSRVCPSRMKSTRVERSFVEALIVLLISCVCGVGRGVEDHPLRPVVSLGYAPDR